MKFNDDILATTSGADETHKLGRSLAALAEPGDIICLYGDLGAGKTAFTKGFCHGLGYNPDQVNSPTFTLIHEYRGKTLPVFHFDAYRIKNVAEALEIGTEDYLYGEGVCLIEWPQRIMELIPPEAVHLYIEKVSADVRSFLLTRNPKKPAN